MSQDNNNFVLHYSWWKVPLFLALLLVNGLCFIMWPDLESQWVAQCLAVAGYAIFLGCGAFIVHIIARRGRAVEVRDGRLIYGFWRRYDDPFSRIFDVTFKEYYQFYFNMLGIVIWKWDGTKVRLLGSLMKGKPARNVVRLRDVLGLSYEPEEDVFKKGERWR
jgi:hypothetical protein